MFPLNSLSFRSQALRATHECQFLKPEEEIVSTGYVIHTLHASLWCLLTTGSFQECVLKAVNLGGDTDTTGCVAGGLAGVVYGLQSIPNQWTQQLGELCEPGHV